MYHYFLRKKLVLRTGILRDWKGKKVPWKNWFRRTSFASADSKFWGEAREIWIFCENFNMAIQVKKAFKCIQSAQNRVLDQILEHRNHQSHHWKHSRTWNRSEWSQSQQEWWWLFSSVNMASAYIIRIRILRGFFWYQCRLCESSRSQVNWQSRPPRWLQHNKNADDFFQAWKWLHNTSLESEFWEDSFGTHADVVSRLEAKLIDNLVLQDELQHNKNQDDFFQAWT